jgi:hypothetical protein
MSRAHQVIKGLIISSFIPYALYYALDYRGNLADLLAFRTLIPYWRRPDSSNFSHRCCGGRHQVGHGPRGLVSQRLSQPVRLKCCLKGREGNIGFRANQIEQSSLSKCLISHEQARDERFLERDKG